MTNDTVTATVELLWLVTEIGMDVVGDASSLNPNTPGDTSIGAVDVVINSAITPLLGNGSVLIDRVESADLAALLEYNLIQLEVDAVIL